MTYPGGKAGSGVYQTLINLMPPHDTYIEPFLGAGAVLRMKRPARWSIGIDADIDVITRWAGVELPGLEIIHADAIQWLAGHAGFIDDHVLVYCDPPYLRSTRRQQRPIYRCELDEEQHRELLRVLLRLPCLVMISGYYSELYATALNRWRAHRFMTTTRGGSPAEEWVWMNFPPPLALHDYRYLGSNFRERERIKRKQLRWKSRLLKMDELERHALLAAIDEFRELVSVLTQVLG